VIVSPLRNFEEIALLNDLSFSEFCLAEIQTVETSIFNANGKGSRSD
jgi:hypothetical protein